jgi:hypothetical protein
MTWHTNACLMLASESSDGVIHRTPEEDRQVRNCQAARCVAQHALDVVKGAQA